MRSATDEGRRDPGGLHYFPPRASRRCGARPPAARAGAKSIALMRSPCLAILSEDIAIWPTSSCAWRKCSIQLAGALGEAAHVVQTSFRPRPGYMRLIAHPRVAHHCLHHLDRHHQQRGRNDDDPAAVRLLHDIIEMLDEIGIERFRRHEDHREVLRLAGKQIALADVLDMLADVGAHPRQRDLARLVAARVAKQTEGLERKLGVDRQPRSSPGNQITQSGRDLLESVYWKS